jgi:glycosyltransferase involved in cell wall biosynthesis
LLEQGIAFHFVLAGANPQDPVYEQQIRDRIEQSALAARTTVTGFVKGDRKWGLLQDADVFVLPSAYENFGIAVAEAMAVGTPVVISREVYISNEIEASAAGWVCDRDLDSLTASLKDCLASAAKRAQRGENARQLVLREYQWPAIAQRMIQVYQDCLDRTAAT